MQNKEKIFDTEKVPDAPDISHMLPTVDVGVVMDEDKKRGQHEYYCDIKPVDATYLYQVEWALTTKLKTNLFLHQSSFVKYEKKEIFRERTALKESHLVSRGIKQLGFTVRF